jgi:hypothetical protein
MRCRTRSLIKRVSKGLKEIEETELNCSKTRPDWNQPVDFEKESIPAFEAFIKRAHCSIVLLLIGFALQFLAAILL